MLPARLQGFVPQKMMVENKVEEIHTKLPEAINLLLGYMVLYSGAKKKNCFYALMGNTVDG